MDAAEYKHVVLGLIFLKYLSDAFDELYAEIKNEDGYWSVEAERDEFLAEGLYWVPEEARWENLKNNATDPAIGKMVDD
ncbi:type I restriction-modification system subunit M N-terminal domain-containing protein, partial [Lactococcus petauri]